MNRIPSDVALMLAQSPEAWELTKTIASALGLDDDEAHMLHHVVIGSVAEGIDAFMKF